MPIVVRELVIRARVEEAEAGAGAGGAARPAASAAALTEVDVQRVVAMCVEKVMQTLERQRER
jgi:hypothetical protein